MTKILSLFSGIGAFERALKRVGVNYELINYCEINKYASKSYAAIHNVNEGMNLGDITKINIDELPRDIDLITYGFPCQDISIAGKQKGLLNEDGTKTRSGLFFDALKVIEKTKPKVAVAENVKNLTSKKFKEQFKIVLDSLEQAGYNNYWKVLNAKDYGIPQNRERVFIISIRKDIDDNSFQIPKGFPLELRLKDVLDDKVDKKYYLSDVQVKKMHIESNGDEKFIIDDMYSNREPRIYEEYSPAIRAERHGLKVVEKPVLVGGIGEKNFGKQYRQGNRVYDSNAIAMALNASPVGNAGGNSYLYKVEDSKVRKLTPKECFRLMGFDDEDFEKAAKVSSQTQLYKQAGNSIVVNVLETIFKELRVYLEK